MNAKPHTKPDADRYETATRSSQASRPPLRARCGGIVGIGLGVRYADDPGVDVFLRRRFGMDVMVGRSGIFKPAFFADIGANDGLSAGGFEAAFTVML